MAGIEKEWIKRENPECSLQLWQKIHIYLQEMKILSNYRISLTHLIVLDLGKFKMKGISPESNSHPGHSFLLMAPNQEANLRSYELRSQGGITIGETDFCIPGGKQEASTGMSEDWKLTRLDQSAGESTHSISYVPVYKYGRRPTYSRVHRQPQVGPTATRTLLLEDSASFCLYPSPLGQVR